MYVCISQIYIYIYISMSSYLYLQVAEYDTPEKLLLREEGAFSRMVQSTGGANAEYLRSLVLRIKEDSMQQIQISSRWSAAAQFAISLNLASALNDLRLEEEEDESCCSSVLKETRTAVITLQQVLEGKHDEVIEDTLNECMVPRDKWWSNLYTVIEGMKNNYNVNS